MNVKGNLGFSKEMDNPRNCQIHYPAARRYLESRYHGPRYLESRYIESRYHGPRYLESWCLESWYLE